MNPYRYERSRIYVDEYDPQMGFNNFIVVIPRKWEPDTWKATQIAQEILWQFSIFVGKDMEDFYSPPSPEYPRGVRYFNGEHDFSVTDLLYDDPKNWVILLSDLGS
jgi:hypothetical protein